MPLTLVSALPSLARLGVRLINPVKNPTTAPTPPLTLAPLLSSLSFRSSASASARSVSGVNTRVSLYPASRRRSSRRSYVLEVPRR